MTMLEEGIQSEMGEREASVLDIAELLLVW